MSNKVPNERLDFNELFDPEREKTNELIVTLGQQVAKFAAEVKTYQFLITRIMVEQRKLNDRISELESRCAFLALKSLRRCRDADSQE